MLMGLSKLSILNGVYILVYKMKKVAALQFLRHHPVQSVSFWIFLPPEGLQRVMYDFCVRLFSGLPGVIGVRFVYWLFTS